jgi:hypothetical protein
MVRCCSKPRAWWAGSGFPLCKFRVYEGWRTGSMQPMVRLHRIAAWAPAADASKSRQRQVSASGSGGNHNNRVTKLGLCHEARKHPPPSVECFKLANCQILPGWRIDWCDRVHAVQAGLSRSSSHRNQSPTSPAHHGVLARLPSHARATRTTKLPKSARGLGCARADAILLSQRRATQPRPTRFAAVMPVSLCVRDCRNQNDCALVLARQRVRRTRGNRSDP